MSSHHIIRENQEAAIFLIDKKALIKEVIETFFEWSPLILTSEACFILLSRWGYKADAVICEKGFVENFETELAMQHPVDIIKVPNKEQTINEGLHYLDSKGCQAVNLFSTDLHLWKNPMMSTFSKKAINIVHGKERGQSVNSGLYEKWLPALSKIRIIPLTNDQLFIFKYQNGNSYKQKLNTELIINIDKDGIFGISSYQSFLVWEPI